MCLVCIVIETKKYSKVSAVEVIRDKYERVAELKEKEFELKKLELEMHIGHGGARMEAEVGVRARGEEETSGVGI